MVPNSMADFYDEDDDDFFPEYNPQPYRGGYDITHVYGEPLPPSLSTCYHSSSSSPTPPPALVPTPPTQTHPSPPPPSPAAPPESSPPAGDQSGKHKDRDGNGHAEPMPHPFHFWGYWYVGGAEWCGKGQVPWQWAADYLLGHLYGLVSTMHEIPNFGNLNHAYERHHPSLPVSIQIDPTNAGQSHTEEVNLHFQSHVNEQEESGYGYGRGQHVLQEDEVDLSEWWFPEDGGGDDYYREQVFSQSHNICAYENHGGSTPISVEVEPNYGVTEVRNSDAEYHYVYGGTEVRNGDAEYHYLYGEPHCLPSESSRAYEMQSFSQEPLTVRLEPEGQLRSFEMNYAENFVEQLFSHGKEEIMSHEIRSYEEASSSFPDIEPSVPSLLDHSPSFRFHQQEIYSHSKHESECNDGCHEESYWPFRTYSDYDY